MNLRKLIMLVLIGLLLSGCTPSTAELIADYADSPIIIKGLTEAEFTVTPSQLAQLDCQEGQSILKGQTVQAKGPTLNTFLAAYGHQQIDFKKIRLIGQDGYKMILRDDLLENEVILAITAGDEPLPEKQRPLRILIPEANSNYWVYQITRMELEQ